MNNWIEIIYLQLYKDTNLLFMQAYKKLQGILNYIKNKKRQYVYSKFKGTY